MPFQVFFHFLETTSSIPAGTPIFSLHSSSLHHCNHPLREAPQHARTVPPPSIPHQPSVLLPRRFRLHAGPLALPYPSYL